MRKNINRKSQARLVGELNSQFTELGEAGRFATAIVATYLATSRQLTICNAGHPRPLWFRADQGAWSILSGREGKGTDGIRNLPLGIDGQVGYDQMQIPLGEGDFLLFYTDALIEALDPQEKPLAEEGLLDLVAGLDLTSPETAARALIDSLDRYRGSRIAEDDQTFLLLKHTAGKPRRLSLREKFDVYAKVFGLKRV
jgi:sigma-B regulation protein RsbU (phosphoserine phosphatase)